MSTTDPPVPSSPPGAAPAAPSEPKPRFGFNPLKWVFALEYVMQGLANPFQGITYQPFFRHLKVDYGLTEAATQRMFAQSYLAWSFKPVLGFFIDAYGRTRTLLIVFLSLATAGFLLTPLFDVSAKSFFGFMFAVSVVLAATDVSVDRATVIAGDEEAKATGRSKASTVGLNQAICWAAIYGTSIVAAVLGGYVADNVPINGLVPGLALVPLLVLAMVWQLPRDKVAAIPLRRSIGEFWAGLNTGPILAVMLFFFIFHLQPMMGPLWNNYAIEQLHFTQTQVGIGDGASYVGYFVGVLAFVWKGIKLQERLGLRKLFRIYILASVVLGLAQFLLLDPWFSVVSRVLARALPFLTEETWRLVHLCVYNALLYLGQSLIRMSTFSLVGAVIPVRAAGSLFAGFMSVVNLAYSFAYASGAWLYDNGLNWAPLRALQQGLFGMPGEAGQSLSLHVLVLFNGAAYLLSFVCVHLLPDRKQTLETDEAVVDRGPERWAPLGASRLRIVNGASLLLGLSVLGLAVGVADLDWISSTLASFFGVTMLRKALLDATLRRMPQSSPV